MDGPVSKFLRRWLYMGRGWGIDRVAGLAGPLLNLSYLSPTI